jgi:CubicO group peptidase (beta-lactamase class C family)
VLLGYIVEDETGLSYADALQEMITNPIALNTTYYPTGIDPEMNEADSFTYREGSWEPASRTNMMIPGGAGAIASTAEETARFFRHLLKGEILTAESLQKMTAFEGSFGLGLIRFPFGDQTFIGYDGGIDGFRSNASHYADGDLTMAILSNGLNYNFNNVLIGTLSIVLGQEYEIPNFEERAALMFNQDELEQYTGTYSSANFPLDIQLFLDGDNLMAQATGQGAFPLTINSETTMAYEAAGINMEFSDFSDGKYHAFSFTQAGQQFDFTRVESSE